MENNQTTILIPAPAVKILGVPIWSLRLQESVELAKNLTKAKRKVLFSTTSSYPIIVAQNSTDFFNHFLQADVVLPDGMSSVLLARLLKHKIPERVAGPDFVDAFLPVAEKEGFKLFFLGATNHTLEKLKTNCLKKYPLLNIVGLLAPPFSEFDNEIDRRLVDTINQAHPDVLFVGMTAPKQELWLSRNFDQLDVLFAMGIGASFDYLAGNKPRVPKWLGRLGFEWLYRLILEPRRLWHRNLNNIFVVWLLAKNCLTGVFRKHLR
jgi:N-acetylglucosaminyldiphosphoundecaprenol N-acetyl-beta-D-mannosaminyltransferase